jgi:hypothetical protein
MRPTRLLSTTIVVGVTAAATFFACGGDDGGGGNGNTDAPVTIDAKVFMDAPPAMGIGAPCTPSSDGSGQGDCPVGYTCLKLGSNAPAWCSKSCTTGSGDQCDVGYTGPGVGNCMWNVSFNGGSAMYKFCGVICAGTAACAGSNSGCDGTCPGQMTCTQDLGSASGSACK